MIQVKQLKKVESGGADLAYRTVSEYPDDYIIPVAIQIKKFIEGGLYPKSTSIKQMHIRRNKTQNGSRARTNIEKYFSKWI